jgi:hypothetical protein
MYVKGTHSWLARHASGDYDDIGTLEDLRKTVIWGEVAFDFCGGCDVREVCGYARCIDYIKKAKLVDGSHLVGVGWGEGVTSVTRGFVLRRRAKG